MKKGKQPKNLEGFLGKKPQLGPKNKSDGLGGKCQELNSQSKTQRKKQQVVRGDVKPERGHP